MKLIILLLVSLSSYAGDPGPEDKFFVKSVDGTDVSGLAAPNVNILPAHRKVASTSTLPSVADRERVFDQTGLGPQLKDWDEFEKDSLYIKLREKGTKALERILEEHPQLKGESLEAAQKIIAKEETP